MVEGFDPKIVAAGDFESGFFSPEATLAGLSVELTFPATEADVFADARERVRDGSLRDPLYLLQAHVIVVSTACIL